VEIRVVTKSGLPAVKAVLKEAFWRQGKSEVFNEWELAQRVMSDDGYIDELCLLAKDEDNVVGYILLSRATIGNLSGLSLGPVAVKPVRQKSGIGKALMRHALNKAKEMGFEWVAVLGGDYYRQFGFVDASDFGVVLSENNPENVYLKILFLQDDMRTIPGGKLRYCSSFYDADGALL
jgi:putative acetyltransferase